ncbi:MAG TPA: ParB/RepB/Spo0J family partition protein [Actinocrinis sp.]
MLTATAVFDTVGAQREPRDVERVPLLRLRPADSPRLDGEVHEHVRILAGATARLPPILVHRHTMRVVDGMHRYRAALLRGDVEIEVTYLDGDDEDVFVHAVAANVAHGLPLSLRDRRAAALRILKTHPDWSDRSVATTTGLSPKTVGAVRRGASVEIPQSGSRLGRDGRRRTMPRADPAGGSGGGETARGALEDSRAHDARAAIESLSRDPSLRLSDSGRSLLRRLMAGAPMAEDLETFVSAVPPHCVDSVTQLAALYAKSWESVARKLRAASRG